MGGARPWRATPPPQTTSGWLAVSIKLISWYYYYSLLLLLFVLLLSLFVSWFLNTTGGNVNLDATSFFFGRGGHYPKRTTSIHAIICRATIAFIPYPNRTWRRRLQDAAFPHPHPLAVRRPVDLAPNVLAIGKGDGAHVVLDLRFWFQRRIQRRHGDTYPKLVFKAWTKRLRIPVWCSCFCSSFLLLLLLLRWSTAGGQTPI